MRIVPQFHRVPGWPKVYRVLPAPGVPKRPQLLSHSSPKVFPGAWNVCVPPVYGVPGGQEGWFPPVHRVPRGWKYWVTPVPGVPGGRIDWVPPVPRVPLGGQKDWVPPVRRVRGDRVPSVRMVTEAKKTGTRRSGTLTTFGNCSVLILISCFDNIIRAKRLSHCYISKRKYVLCSCVRLILVLGGSVKRYCCRTLRQYDTRYVRTTLYDTRYVRYVCTWYQPAEIYTYVRYIPDTYVPGTWYHPAEIYTYVRYVPPVDAHVWPQLHLSAVARCYNTSTNYVSCDILGGTYLIHNVMKYDVVLFESK